MLNNILKDLYIIKIKPRLEFDLKLSYSRFTDRFEKIWYSYLKNIISNFVRGKKIFWQLLKW